MTLTLTWGGENQNVGLLTFLCSISHKEIHTHTHTLAFFSLKKHTREAHSKQSNKYNETRRHCVTRWIGSIGARVLLWRCTCAWVSRRWRQSVGEWSLRCSVPSVLLAPAPTAARLCRRVRVCAAGFDWECAAFCCSSIRLIKERRCSNMSSGTVPQRQQQPGDRFCLAVGARSLDRSLSHSLSL